MCTTGEVCPGQRSSIPCATSLRLGAAASVYVRDSVSKWEGIISIHVRTSYTLASHYNRSRDSTLYKNRIGHDHATRHARRSPLSRSDVDPRTSYDLPTRQTRHSR